MLITRNIGERTTLYEDTSLDSNIIFDIPFRKNKFIFIILNISKIKYTNIKNKLDARPIQKFTL